jgi:hypothetical protein
MSSRNTQQRDEGSDRVVTPDELVIGRLRRLMRERPLLVVAGAGALGGVLGGILFSRLGRLLFLGAVGYVGNELWHREGRLAIDFLVERLSSPPKSGGETISPPQSGGGTTTPPEGGSEAR